MMVFMYTNEKGEVWRSNFKRHKKICYDIEKDIYNNGGNLSPNWKDEKEMNKELSKLCKELKYIVIDEGIDNDWIYDDGRRGTHKGNNGVDLTLMIDDKMIMFELKNSSHCFQGAQGLGQLMYYIEKDKDYMKWREYMTLSGSIERNYDKLKHSKLIGILVLTDGRNIKYLLEIIKKIDYPIKLLVFNPVILKSSIAKDEFIKSLKEVIE